MANLRETKRRRLRFALGLLVISGGCVSSDAERWPRSSYAAKGRSSADSTIPSQTVASRAVTGDPQLTSPSTETSPFRLTGYPIRPAGPKTARSTDDLETLAKQVESRPQHSPSGVTLGRPQSFWPASPQTPPTGFAAEPNLPKDNPSQTAASPANLASAPLGDSMDLGGDLLSGDLELPSVQATSLPIATNTINGLPTRPISENEMLHLALSQSPVLRPLGLRILESPESATTVYDRSISASDPFFGPQAALAAFDSTLSASATSQNNDRVFNNATLGGDVQELTQDYATFNAGIQKRTFSGAVWDLTTRKQYDANNRAANRFPSYWETQLEAGVRQPLLRGAGKEFNSIAGPNAQPGFNFSKGIMIARLNTRITEADFEIAVRTFVRDLYAVYWDLKRQYRSYESIVAARDLAYRTWQGVLARSHAQVDGGEANKEAQARAKYYRYCREAELALGGGDSETGLFATERRLRRMVGLPTSDGQILQPIEDGPEAEFHFDFESVFNQALANRTELKRQSLKVQQQQLQLVASKNFLLPQLDMIGRYRLRGFGDDLTGNDQQRFGSAYDDFFTGDHQEWEFGLELGVTAGRRQARAAVRNATLLLAKERNLLAEQQRTLEFEIKDAIAEVDAAYASLNYSRLQYEAAQDRLRSSEVLFNSDKIQIEFLLDAQEAFVQTERQYAADLSRYSLAIVSVSAQSGTLLDDVGIHLQNGSSQTHAIYTPAE
ncbi:TolC family protein [Novipirellula sp. SH528]|uniref:TolC family protein n=1 Tax=Novipirellula sp. SH528 TaxID=3454466 RepID=UPI003F9F0399